MGDGSKNAMDGAISAIPTVDIPNLNFGSHSENGIPNTGENFSDIGGNVKNAMDALGEMKTCISQGLFKMSLNAAGVMDTSVGINVSTLPAAVIVGAVGIAISLLLGAIGVIVLITASAGNTDSYQNKGKVANRTGVGMILLVLACTFGVIGMSCYTGGSEQEIHNPMILMMRLGLSISQAFGQTPAVPDGVDFGSMADVAMLDESGSMGDIIKSLHAVFTLHYSYAFIMAWIAAVLLVVAAILSAIAKQELINQRHMGGANVAL